jgi:hypothetical protein
MGLGSLASLVLKLGGLFLQMGGTRDTLERIESPDGPSIWESWIAERAERSGTAPARQRDNDRPAPSKVTQPRAIHTEVPRAPEDRRERVPGQPPRSWARVEGGRR